MARLRDLDTARRAIKDEADLQSVCEHYGLEFSPLSTDNNAAPCPFHDEEEPSFAVSESKQVYLCYGCHAAGDVFEFVEQMEGVSHVAAIRKVAEIVGFPISQYEREETEEEKREREQIDSMERVALECQNNRVHKAFKLWKTDRVLSNDIIETYGIGFSTGIHSNVKYADDLGLTWKRKWKNAIVIPLRDGHGRIVGFRTRPIDGEVKSYAPKKDHPVAIPDIYGLYEARRAARDEGFLVLVEGEVDTWQMVAHGYENTAALLSNKIRERTLDYIASHGINEIVVLPDGDKGGRQLAEAAARIHHKKVAVKIAIIQDGDPDDILLTDPSIIEDAIGDARYGIEYMVENALNRRVASVTDKIEVLNSLKDVLADSTRTEQELAHTMLAERLDMTKDAIHDFYVEEVGEESLDDPRYERMIISQAIHDGVFAGEVVNTLSAEDFNTIKNRRIFQAIISLFSQGVPVERDTVLLALTDQKTQEYASKLQEQSSRESAEYVMSVLKDKAVRRRTRGIAKAILSDTGNPSIETKDLLSHAMGQISNVVVGSKNMPQDMSESVHNLVETVHERVQDPDTIVGMDLGRDWQTLNRTIHGFKKSRYMVLAAPSGDGKTACGVGMVSTASIVHNLPSLVMTFETDVDTITQRLISHRAQVDQEKMITGYLKQEELQLIHQAAAEVGGAPIKITSRGSTFEECVAIIRHDHMTRGTELFFIDYIQLMIMAGANRISRYQELGHISRGLLELAHDLDTRILVVAQLNREGSKKGSQSDHTDIGEAFKIAQDADIFVTFAAKSEEELEMDGPELGNRRGGIWKNRSDGRVGVRWNMEAELATQTVREIPS